MTGTTISGAVRAIDAGTLTLRSGMTSCVPLLDLDASPAPSARHRHRPLRVALMPSLENGLPFFLQPL